MDVNLKEYYKLVKSKGGKVLENRTTMHGINIGDVLPFQSLGGSYQVLFFYKDKVFDHCPMVFTLNKKSGLPLMVSSKLLVILKQNDASIKRRRRTK